MKQRVKRVSQHLIRFWRWKLVRQRREGRLIRGGGSGTTNDSASTNLHTIGITSPSAILAAPAQNVATLLELVEEQTTQIASLMEALRIQKYEKEESEYESGSKATPNDALLKRMGKIEKRLLTLGKELASNSTETANQLNSLCAVTSSRGEIVTLPDRLDAIENALANV